MLPSYLQLTLNRHLYSYDITFRLSFGKRTPTNQYRMNECVLLEPSELLVVREDFHSGLSFFQSFVQVDYPIEKKEDSLMPIENQLEEFQRKKSSRIREVRISPR